MAFIPAPNAVRLCLQMVWASQIVEICLGFLNSGSVGLTELTDLTDDMEAWRVAELVPLLSADIGFTQWYGTVLTTATAPTYVLPITVSTVGGVALSSVPNNVALVTTFQTALRGRSYRGRVYTPGICEVEMETSTTMTAAIAAAVNDAYAAINGSIAGSWAHCIISYQNNNVLRTTAARTPVNAYRTLVGTDSQRRRLEGRGS